MKALMITGLSLLIGMNTLAAAEKTSTPTKTLDCKKNPTVIACRTITLNTNPCSHGACPPLRNLLEELSRPVHIDAKAIGAKIGR